MQSELNFVLNIKNKTMKTKLYLSFLLITAIAFTSCRKDWFDVVRGSGPVVSEDRSVATYDEVDLSIPADIYISQGNNERITIEAQENILDVIETDVNNHKLKLRFSNGVSVRRFDPIKVYITTRDITEVSVSGAGNIYNDGPLVTDVLNIRVSGSGNIELDDIDSPIVDTRISGSGKVYLSGFCDEQYLQVSGSGDIYGFDLESSDTEVEISGSGKAEVRVEHYLKARISGSGKVFYKGNPNHVDSKISGSGGVYHVD